MQRKLLLSLIGAGIAVFLLAGAVTANAILRDDDGEDSLNVRLAGGGTHTVSASESGSVSIVEADYELRNVGAVPARVSLTLMGPDGTVLDSETQIVDAGDAVEIEVGYAFVSASGPSGTYSATLAVLSGDVRLTEGGVDLNEEEDDDGQEDD